MTISRTTRLFLSTAFTLSLGCSLALGCASTQEAALDSTSPTSQLSEAPPEVVARLTACVNQGAARLTSTESSILLGVNVTEEGNVVSVNIKSSLLGDPGIESCMRRSFLGTSLPASVTGLRASPRAEGGTITSESRSLVGNPAVLAAPAVALGPIVLVAAGVTVVVGITIYAMSVYRNPPPADERPKKDCNEAQRGCIKYCVEARKLDWLYDAIEYQFCVRGCMSALGC